MAAEGGGGAALQVLVQILIDLLKNEISLIRGLKREADALTMELDTAQKLLNDADKKINPSEAVKSLLQRLENAAFEAENVLDEFNYHSLSKTLNTNINKQKVPTCCSLFIDCPQKRKMAVSIKKIKKDLHSTKKETWRGLDNILFNATVAGTDTDAFSADPIFIGRDEVVSKIVETLITSVTDHKCVFSVLPIVGMGGLGKTTLTRHVFKHQKIKTQFGSLIWVHVSQVFDRKSLFNKILNELTSSQSREGESKKQNLSLEEALKNKTYLLVLDDAWNEEVLKWTNFFNSLSEVTNTKGNGIIVTTRNTEVASIVRTLPIHQLKFLSKEDCWSIIRAKTFGCVPSGINESVGREIAERCGGLPLAASVIGGVLKIKNSADKWHSIKQNWRSEGEVAHKITEVLELSINNLSSRSLKKCFAYCSIFPKGEHMVKEVLIEMWMAEGFLQADGDDDMESVGDKMYNVLLHSSLLQVAKKEADEHYVERCVMHELMHDVASSVLGSSNTADVVTRVRYLFHDERHSSSPITKEVAEHLRTLIFRGDQLSDDTIFSDFKSLHVLTLEVNSLEELPISIMELIHLRSLNISETSIGVLPDWIGVLHHLQTLRAERLEKLPSTIKYLINLRHLHIPILEELPAEIGRLTFLQTLPAAFIVQDTNGYKIEELRSLNDLKGSLKVACLEKVRNKEEAEKANLSKKSKLSELRLEWSSSREEVERNDEKVLEGLQPHSNLKKLFIQGFDGKIFPEWTLKMKVRNVPQGSWVGLNQLMEITFFNCKECEEIPVLGHLPNLKSLYFCNLRNVKSINSSFYGIGNEAGVVFPVLETLKLCDMDRLKEWAEVESGSTSEVKIFPNLQTLKISNCNQLMKVPMLGHLPNLKSLYLGDLSNVESINSSFYGIGNETGVVFPVLETLELSDMDSLIEWEEVESGSTSEVKVFPNLQTLKISNCNQLMKVPMLGHLPNLKSLYLGDLSNVKSINSSFYGIGKETGIVFPVLETLELCGMDSLKEWAGVESDSTSEVKVFPNLQSLKISNCNQLIKAPTHFSSLSQLELSNFGMKELPEWSDQVISHTNSRFFKLKLSDCKRLMRLRSTPAMRLLIEEQRVDIICCPELHFEQQQKCDDDSD